MKGDLTRSGSKPLPGISRHLLLLCAALACALLPWCGCSDSDPASSAGKPETAGAPDPLAGAPADRTEFLAWAEKKLESPTPTVPIPVSPRLGKPPAGLVCLTDTMTFRRARKACDWNPPDRDDTALATVGPFRSDDPATNEFATQLVPKTTADGEDSLALFFGGFQVQSEEVGGVELMLSVPFGKHIALVWSHVGRVYIPVESHDKPFTVLIPTDDFVSWTGPRDKISLLTDGLGEGVIEVHRMRFLPRDLSYPKPVDIGRVRLGHEIRSAIHSHCPGEITFENITLPGKARLQVGLGSVDEAVAARAGQSPSTRCEIIVTHEDDSQTVLDRQVTPSNSWLDATVSLARWGGRTVSVMLRSTSESTDAIAFWGNPTIYQPLDDPPMLVVYLIDTVAAEHVGFQGYPRETMPRLAMMAHRGVWFSRMFSNSSRTIESIPDLMLSMPVERHGVHHNSTPAPVGLVTIADALRAAGHATASFCTNVNAGPRQGMAQGFDTFVDKITSHLDNVDRTIPLEDVMNWINHHRDQPTFIYIHTAEPHSPYTPPEGFRDRFDPDYPGRFTGVGFHDAKHPRDIAHIKALYDEELVYADARFGLFLDALQQEGLLDKTDFLVTSDHGEEFLQHNDWEHGRNLHNEETRVPLVAFGPTFGNHGRVDTPAQLFDIMPTILDMYGLPTPYALDGRSLLPMLRPGGAASDALGDRDIYASNHNYRIDYNLLEYSVIENARWKLVLGSVGPSESQSRFVLFDLAADPRERRNVLHANPDVTRRLAERLIRWRCAQHVYDAGKPTTTIIDPTHMAELQALGYLGDSSAPSRIENETDDDSNDEDPDD